MRSGNQVREADQLDETVYGYLVAITVPVGAPNPVSEAVLRGWLLDAVNEVGSFDVDVEVTELGEIETERHE